MSMGGRRHRNPFGSWQERTIREAELDTVERLEALLEDTGTVEISESLAIWDLYGVATDYDTDEISGDGVLDRVEDYPDDYELVRATAHFEQAGDGPVEYEISLHATRTVDDSEVRIPDTRIEGRLNDIDDLDQALEERYGIEPENLSRPGPYT